MSVLSAEGCKPTATAMVGSSPWSSFSKLGDVVATAYWSTLHSGDVEGMLKLYVEDASIVWIGSQWEDNAEGIGHEGVRSVLFDQLRLTRPAARLMSVFCRPSGDTRYLLLLRGQLWNGVKLTGDFVQTFVLQTVNGGSHFQIVNEMLSLSTGSLPRGEEDVKDMSDHTPSTQDDQPSYPILERSIIAEQASFPQQHMQSPNTVEAEQVSYKENMLSNVNASSSSDLHCGTGTTMVEEGHAQSMPEDPVYPEDPSEPSFPSSPLPLEEAVPPSQPTLQAIPAAQPPLLENPYPVPPQFASTSPPMAAVPTPAPVLRNLDPTPAESQKSPPQSQEGAAMTGPPRLHYDQQSYAGKLLYAQRAAGVQEAPLPVSKQRGFAVAPIPSERDGCEPMSQQSIDQMKKRRKLYMPTCPTDITDPNIKAAATTQLEQSTGGSVLKIERVKGGRPFAFLEMSDEQSAEELATRGLYLRGSRYFLDRYRGPSEQRGPPTGGASHREGERNFKDERHPQQHQRGEPSRGSQ